MTGMSTDYVARVASATPAQLVLINYELLFGFLKDAEAVDPESEGWPDAVQRVKGAVRVLIDGLNFKYDIARDLYGIYLYVNRLLNEARAQRRKDGLRDAGRILRPLYESFAEAERTQSGAEPVMENAQKIYAGLTYSNGRLDEYVEEGAGRGYRA
ncbi:MAG: flagellar protein FliS [Firmicutes bacterium]|nr:flagellar protein FliS [Bacillota bacterium]